MNKEEKIGALNRFIQRMKNLKEIQTITGEETLSCYMNERDIKELLYLCEDYLFVLEHAKDHDDYMIVFKHKKGGAE